MFLRNVNSLHRVALLFLAFFVLCSQSESNECLKDGKVTGDCPSFTATLVRPGNFSVVLGTDEKSLGSDVDVEMRFGDCNFTATIYSKKSGVKFEVPGFRPYHNYLSFGRSGTQLRSSEDSNVFCSGLCQGDCDVHFSWDVKPLSSNIYLDFGSSAELVDVSGSKELSVIAIAMIIVGSVLLFLLLICGVAQFIYCCKCKKSKPQEVKPQEAKSKLSATKPIKQTNLQDKKSTSSEKTRKDKSENNEKAREKSAEFITSNDLVSPPKIRKDKAAEFITSQDLKSPTRDKQKSSSSQKEEQAQED